MNTYGIRDRKTNKFISIGLKEDKYLIVGVGSWKTTNVWSSLDDVQVVYEALKDNFQDFEEQYFVDKLTEEEIEEMRQEWGWI